MGFIYLIWATKYKLKNMNVYKVGRTEQKELLKRLRGYGKLGEDYFILYYTKCDLDSQIMEKQIIEEFKEHFLLYEGNEWFMGDSTEMINIIKNQNKKEIVKTYTKEELKEISKELEEIRKCIKEKDEELEEKNEKLLRHIVRFNILEETLVMYNNEHEIKSHFRLNLSHTDEDDNVIFVNMFKWLDRLQYLKNIKNFYTKINLQWETCKGAIWLSIKFHHQSGCKKLNHNVMVFNEECGIGTNTVIFTIVKIIVYFNSEMFNNYETFDNNEYNLSDYAEFEEIIKVEYNLDN